MKRWLAGIVTCGLIISAMAFSAPQAYRQAALQIDIEAKNPWTHLGIKNLPENFQFAIVTDRTGGHRPGVFEAAMGKLNLMQPQFVMSVGDLIEGKRGNTDEVRAQWREFNGFVQGLEMPFFYVPGNHDLMEASAIPLWQNQFGRTYYHFIYHNVLFIGLNSEDPPGYEVEKLKPGRLGPEQLAWLKEVLDASENVRWTNVFLHKPMWQNLEASNWGDVEKLLGDRPRTCFAGHEHTYQVDKIGPHTYYALATTGGSSKLRGVAMGEFDHITWVSMTREGPRLANIALDGIWTSDPVAEARAQQSMPMPMKAAAQGDGAKQPAATAP